MQLLQWSNVPGLHLACKLLSPGEEIGWHDHGCTTLCVVYAGGMEEEDVQRVRRRTTGDLVFRSAPERHRNRVGDRLTRVLTLEFAASAMEALANEGLAIHGTHNGASPRAVELARLVQAELRSPDELSGIELHGLVYELLATALRALGPRSTVPPTWLQSAHRRLTDEYRASPDLEALAADHLVSPYHLARAFREHYGISVAAYLRQLRVTHALGLLADTELPLAHVALDSGFYDQSHLTHAVKRQTGLTPRAYRRHFETHRRG